MLIADASSEWLHYAAPLVLQQDLAPSARLIASVAPTESTVYESKSTRALQTTITESAGALNLSADLFNVASQRSARNISARAQPAHIIAGLNDLAKQIDPRAVPFSTNNDHALELLSAGLTAGNLQTKLARLHEAITADPSFGLAYIALVEALAANRSPEVTEALRDGEAHQDSFSALDRGRFHLLASQLSRAPLPQQIEAAAALLKVDPNNADALGALGTSQFLAGDAAAGRQSLERALEINPESVALRHQLALGLVSARQYAAAERILSSAEPAGNGGLYPARRRCPAGYGNFREVPGSDWEFRCQSSL